MNFYDETIKLAQLIKLIHSTDGTTVWRNDNPQHPVPWRPFEVKEDKCDVQDWVEVNHPGWYPISACPSDYCRAVLKAFGKPDYYDKTIKLAQLIGLDHCFDPDKRQVGRVLPEGTLTWRPFENMADCQMVIGWVRRQGAEVTIEPVAGNCGGWRATVLHCARYTQAHGTYRQAVCEAVLKAFDQPKPNQLTPPNARL